jgi:hypothetical protein
VVTAVTVEMVDKVDKVVRADVVIAETLAQMA